MYFKHNIKTYKKFESIILKYYECCIVAAMGTGKTDICIEFIKKFSLNTLVILPNVDLCNQWKKIADMNGICTLSTITYHSFTKNYAVLNGFDCYIFDEAHHMDSKVWGKAIRKFRESLINNEYIIGLTGDPVRYFDSCKNVVDTVFNGHVVYGHNQYSAIMKGVLPKVVYVCAVYDTEGLYKKYYPKATTEELKGRLNFVYENCKKINDILINHSHDTMKGFVFVDRINSIPKGIEIVSKAFPNEIVRYVHSSLPNGERCNSIEAFKNDKTGFMVAVDIFNEGHHVDGVNTIIMLRKTGSPTVYAQQIGRGMSANYTGSTIVYDFVGNKESIKSVKKRIDIITGMIESELNEESIEHQKSGRKYKTSKQVIVHDYSKDFLEVIEEINNLHSKESWTKDEDEFLRNNYNTKGVDVCANKLGRTRVSCQKRARRLGIIINAKTPWTKDEDDILRNFYPTMGYAVASKLPGRSERACTARANNYLGIVSRSVEKEDVSNNEQRIKRWSKHEDGIIKKYYPDYSMIEKHLPNRTYSAIKSRINRLGLFDREKQEERQNRWTEEEYQIIREKYPTMGSKIVNLLPNRSLGAIKYKANMLGVRRNTSVGE